MEAREKTYIINEIVSHLAYYDALESDSKRVAKEVSDLTKKIVSAKEGVVSKSDFAELYEKSSFSSLLRIEFHKVMSRLGVLVSIAATFDVLTEIPEDKKELLEHIQKNPLASFMLYKTDDGALDYMDSKFKEASKANARQMADADLNEQFQSLKEEFFRYNQANGNREETEKA